MIVTQGLGGGIITQGYGGILTVIIYTALSFMSKITRVAEVRSILWR